MRTPNETEHELAGIDVTRHTLEDACLAFGVPTRREDCPYACSDSRGAIALAHVEWNLGDVTVAVVTCFPLDVDGAEDVVAIRASGRGMGYQTGAGLRLGHRVAEAIERYGPPTRVNPPSYRFADGGFLSLVVRADHVIEINLLSPWLAASCRASESDEALERGDEADQS